MTMPCPQFSLKTMLWLMLCVAALLGGREWGNQSGRERQRREDELAASAQAERWANRRPAGYYELIQWRTLGCLLIVGLLGLFVWTILSPWLGIDV